MTALCAREHEYAIVPIAGILNFYRGAVSLWLGVLGIYFYWFISCALLNEAPNGYLQRVPHL